MKLGLKVKLAAAAVAFAGMFAGSTVASANVLTGIGTINIKSTPYVSKEYSKTTTDACSDITLGNVTIYGSIQVTTYSEIAANQFAQSNPWTVCAGNSSTYLGQYVTIDAKMGQKIRFEAKALSYASDQYTADIISWDYH